MLQTTIQSWNDLAQYSLQRFWEGFSNFILAFILALIVFIIGWFIAVFVGKLITEILKRLKFNQIFEKGSWDEALVKANFKIDAAGFIGAIVKWVLVIVVLQISAGILGWTAFADLLSRVVGYLPNVIVAALIFVVTVIISDIIEKIVRVSVERVRVGYGHMVSAIVKWAIWIFAIAIILSQLNIGGILPQAIIFGIIAFLALAGGLAFGLGGRDTAAKIIEGFREKVQK